MRCAHLKSGYFPKTLGVMFVFASFGNRMDSFGHFLFPQHEAFYNLVILTTVPAELALLRYSLPTIWGGGYGRFLKTAYCYPYTAYRSPLTTHRLSLTDYCLPLRNNGLRTTTYDSSSAIRATIAASVSS